MDGTLKRILEVVFRLIRGCKLSVVLFAVMMGMLLLPLAVGRAGSAGTVRSVRPGVLRVRAGCGSGPRGRRRRVVGVCARTGVGPLTKYLPLLVRVPVLVTLFSMLERPIACKIFMSRTRFTATTGKFL